MDKVTDSLLQNTAFGVLAAVLLIGIVLFAGWTRNYVEADRKTKETRIKSLEDQVHELQQKFSNELLVILQKHENMMNSMQATFSRMEKLWERMERKLDDI